MAPVAEAGDEDESEAEGGGERRGGKDGYSTIKEAMSAQEDITTYIKRAGLPMMGGYNMYAPPTVTRSLAV